MKKWYQSRTLWMNLILGSIAVGTAFGLDLALSPEEQTAIVGGVIAVVNLVLRLLTSEGISNG